MTECMPGIYRIPVEERENSKNVVELYLVKGAEGQRSLLIDAGYRSRWCYDRLKSALAELGTEPAMLDVFLTHKHADHCGLAHALSERGAVLYMNRAEDRHRYDCLYYSKDQSDTAAQLRVLARNGVTEELAPLIWQKFIDFNSHMTEEHSAWMMVMSDFEYNDIVPGQLFIYGDYRFEALPLCGHTFGQMGLVDREKKLLFSADQVLNVTAPIVGTSHLDEHLLTHYLKSIEDMKERYSGYTVFPAHEGEIKDLSATVDRISRSYASKIESTYETVEADQEQTTWQIARRLYHLTPNKRSDEAFMMVKLIITKTFSMLEYLHDQGRITRREENGTLYWKR